VHQIGRRYLLTLLVATATGLAACAGSTGSASSQVSSDYDGERFNNILVIAVANDYDGRARFERRLVSDLKAAGVSAAPMYLAVSGNEAIERESVEKLVASNAYDAVLISRVVNTDVDVAMKSGTVETQAVRKSGRPINLFRYDYEEISKPSTLDMAMSVSLQTELFAASSKQKVWSVESTIANKSDVEEIIDEAAKTILKGIKRGRLLAN
jgi:hypothetical protein